MWPSRTGVSTRGVAPCRRGSSAGCTGGAATAGVAMTLILIAVVSSRNAAAQPIEVHVQSGSIYAKEALIPRLDSAVRNFMQKPFEQALDFTEEANRIGSLDLTDRQQMSRVLYTQTLATKCGQPGNPFDMVYLGLEDGTFLGYFSPTSYTYRPPSGTMADQLSWDPYDLESINGVCDQTPSACDFFGAVDPDIAAKACLGDVATCGAADISGGVATDPWARLDAGRTNCAAAGDCRFSAYGGRTWDGKVVSSNCARVGADLSSCSDVDIGGSDDSLDLHACESAGACMYIPADVSSGTEEACAAVCTDTCCDGDLRVYYTAGSVGEPVEMTRWRVYDHRARPWYIQQKQRFLSTGEAFSWSSVYTCSTSGVLCISATAMINDDSGGHGVAAVDYTLSMISQLITDELLGLRADLDTTWSYIVEVSGSTPGTLMGSSTESVTNNSAGSVTRLHALQAIHPGVALSAAYLDPNGWPEVDGVVLSQGDIRVEIGTFSFEDRGLVWLIVAGQNTNCSSTDIWNFGKCQTCDNGKEPVDDACGTCATGCAGMGGRCHKCPDGKQPNAEKTICENCPKGKAGKGGQCTQCNIVRGEVPNGDVTGCVCPAGTYDAYVDWMPRLQNDFLEDPPGHCEDAAGHLTEATTKRACQASGTWVSVHHIYCWQRGRRSDPKFDSLNNPSLHDLAHHSFERRCIACPECLTCDSGLVSINSGFSVAADLRNTRCSAEGCEAASTLNVYECENNNCLGFAANDTNASLCGEHHEGLLCDSCEKNYYLSGNLCVHCGEVWRAVKARIEPHGPLDRKIRFYRRVLEKSWPRFNQGWKILAGNFQISASIAANTHIEWPDRIGSFFDMVGDIANLNVMHLPGLACAVTSSFFFKWSLQMALLPAILLGCYALFKYRSRVLIAQAPTKPNLLEQVAVDLSLAVKIGQAKTSISSWAFMSVYLLYPGTCRQIFAMFKCRNMEIEAGYLIADMRQPCFNLDGSYNESYFYFMILASACAVLFAFGIPLVLGLNLYHKRHVIAQNPNYVTLAAFKPLFQFYKPQCYMWEIYFMIQKVILVAVMGIIPPSKLQKIAQVVLSIVVVGAVCNAMPSKTQQFNYANVVSQGTIILNFLAAILLAETSSTVDIGITPGNIEVIVAVGMQIMMLYLVYVIVAKVKEMVAVSSREVQEELLAMKQLSSGETDAKEDVVDQEEADAAVRLMFDFYDYDGGGSVNLCEIQRVLNLFGISFDQAARNAVIELAEEMASYNSVCDELKKQFEKLDVDVSGRIDKQELKQVVLNPEIDLSSFGWNMHQDYGQLRAVDVIFEEIDVSRDAFITWDEFVSVCKQRLNVKDETLSKLQDQVQSTDSSLLVDVVRQDELFSQHLFPSGADMKALDTAGVINACLDARRPAEAMRSLLVRSRMKEERQLMDMDIERLKQVAKEVLVDDEIIDKSVQNNKATLLAEIAKQKEEMSFETFKAIWTAHAPDSDLTKQPAGEVKIINPLGTSKDGQE